MMKLLPHGADGRDAYWEFDLASLATLRCNGI